MQLIWVRRLPTSRVALGQVVRLFVLNNKKKLLIKRFFFFFLHKKIRLGSSDLIIFCDTASREFGLELRSQTGVFLSREILVAVESKGLSLNDKPWIGLGNAVSGVRMRRGGKTEVAFESRRAGATRKILSETGHLSLGWDRCNSLRVETESGPFVVEEDLSDPLRLGCIGTCC